MPINDKNTPESRPSRQGGKPTEPEKLDSAAPRAAFWLGVSGVAPFAAATLLVLFARKPEQRELALRAFTCYSAVILSFLGGIRWGAALAMPAFPLLLRAVLPSLLAFACLMLPPKLALPFLCLLFMAVGWSDSTRPAHGLWPKWFKQLRLTLSVAVISLHLIVMMALLGWF
jgi:hypothetical protein